MTDKKSEINNTLNEDNSYLEDRKINDLIDMAESLKPVDSAQYDQRLESISKTLANINAKMDVENIQLEKIRSIIINKKPLNKMKSISPTTTEFNHEGPVEDTKKTEGDISQNNIGHSQLEIYELLEKIEALEKKILTIENQSNNSNKKFEKIESVVKRFEDLENELPNLFNEKEKKDYEDKELFLEDNTNETLINNDFNEEDKKPKSYILKNILGVFLLLCFTIGILYFFNKFQIIDLSSNEAISSIFYLIDSTYEKFLFYFN
jgi:chaperonin cofactor prefoldin